MSGPIGCSVLLPFFSSVPTDGLQISPEEDAVVHTSNHPEILERGQLGTAGSEGKLIGQRVLFEHPAHDGDINAMALAPGGKRAYTAGKDGRIVESRLVESESGSVQVQTRTLLTAEKPVFALAVSPDGRQLAFSQFSRIWIYDLQANAITNRLSRIDGRIMSLAFDPRNELLAFGVGDGGIYVWNVQRGWLGGEDTLDAVETYTGALSPVVQLVFHPSGRTFFSAERNGRLTVWRLVRTDKEMGLREENEPNPDKEKNLPLRSTSFAAMGDNINNIWLNKSGSLLFAAMKDGSIRRFKIRGLRELRKLPAGPGSVEDVTGFVLSSSGDRPILASIGRSHRIRFWCQLREDDDLDVVPVEEEREEKEEVEDGIRDALAGALRPPPESTGPVPTPIAETVALKTPIGIARSDGPSGYLWVAQKTGTILLFQAGPVLMEASFRDKLESCPAVVKPRL